MKTPLLMKHTRLRIGANCEIKPFDRFRVFSELVYLKDLLNTLIALSMEFLTNEGFNLKKQG